jgi:magnesium-transporting ATPase (P-type)
MFFLVDAAADKLERVLILLGATAVEDKLQKGVSANYYFLTPFFWR